MHFRNFVFDSDDVDKVPFQNCHDTKLIPFLALN